MDEEDGNKTLFEPSDIAKEEWDEEHRGNIVLANFYNDKETTRDGQY